MKKRSAPHQGLLAVVVKGDEPAVGVAHLYVVPKDLVEPNFKRPDARSFPLLLLQLHNGLLRVPFRISQAIKVRARNRAG